MLSSSYTYITNMLDLYKCYYDPNKWKSDSKLYKDLPKQPIIYLHHCMIYLVVISSPVVYTSTARFPLSNITKEQLTRLSTQYLCRVEKLLLVGGWIYEQREIFQITDQNECFLVIFVFKYLLYYLNELNRRHRNNFFWILVIKRSKIKEN